jgi:sn1-specific diacylglycerol lipase
VLDKLLVGHRAKFPHYTLRIVGHSLGAGCATILGFMLRKRFPSLRVTAISPPGGFLSEKLATGCKDFVTSFVLDSDLVPRLSVKTMEHIRDEVLSLIGRIKVCM